MEYNEQIFDCIDCLNFLDVQGRPIFAPSKEAELGKYVWKMQAKEAGDSQDFNIYYFPQFSCLSDFLSKWYGGLDNVLKSVRDCVIGLSPSGVNCLYFASDGAYNCFDRDLLGGTGDGQTVKKFIDFCNAQSYEPF